MHVKYSYYVYGSWDKVYFNPLYIEAGKTPDNEPYKLSILSILFTLRRIRDIYIIRRWKHAFNPLYIEAYITYHIIYRCIAMTFNPLYIEALLFYY